MITDAQIMILLRQAIEHNKNNTIIDLYASERTNLVQFEINHGSNRTDCCWRFFTVPRAFTSGLCHTNIQSEDDACNAQ